MLAEQALESLFIESEARFFSRVPPTSQGFAINLLYRGLSDRGVGPHPDRDSDGWDARLKIVKALDGLFADAWDAWTDILDADWGGGQVNPSQTDAGPTAAIPAGHGYDPVLGLARPGHPRLTR